MRSLRPFAALVLALGLPLAALAAVPQVDNPDMPRDGVTDYDFDIDWRAGGLDDEDTLFGVIVQALVDETGDLYLLDSQLSNVTVFSPEGEPLRVLSREGDGPGESRRPHDLLLLPDDELGLMQIFPGKIVKIDRRGEPAGEFPYKAGGGFAVLVRGKCAGGNVVLAGIDQGFDQGTLTQTYFLRGFEPDGTRVCEYAAKTAEQNFADMVLDESVVDWIWNRFDVADDGSVIVAPDRNGYRFEVYAPDGTLVRRFGRAYEPVVRDEADTAFATAALEAQGRNYPTMPRIVVTDVEPDISSVRVQPDGSVWVLTSRGVRDLDEGVLAVWDVFDAEGVFTHQARIHAEGNGRLDAMFLVGEDRLVLVRNFLNTLMSSLSAETGDEEAEPMEVISGRLVR